jgi:hypothetical protein
MKVMMTLIALVFATQASAIVDADGCYQSYLPNSMFPAVCISGSNEEAAIPTARIAIFHTNTDNVIWCERATTIEILNFDAQVNHIKFGFNPESGMQAIELNGLVDQEGKESGDINFFEVSETVELKYLRLGSDHTSHLLEEMVLSEKCQNL